jgi:hypothetical protein
MARFGAEYKKMVVQPEGCRVAVKRKNLGQRIGFPVGWPFLS